MWNFYNFTKINVPFTETLFVDDINYHDLLPLKMSMYVLTICWITLIPDEANGTFKYKSRAQLLFLKKDVLQACGTSVYKASQLSEGLILKGHRHDWGQCLFTKIIWHEILIENLQKVIQKCTNHSGNYWAINRAEITHKSLYL